MELIKNYGLDISDIGIEPNNGLTWQMTKRKGDKELHKYMFTAFYFNFLIFNI